MSRNFSIFVKKQIVEFYKSGLKTKERILQEYGVTPTLLDELERWYNSTFVIPLLNPYQHKLELAMKKTKPIAKSATKTVATSAENPGKNALEKELLELKKKNQALQKDLEREQLKTRVQDKMIEIMERDYNIPVRKKYGTKQFEK